MVGEEEREGADGEEVREDGVEGLDDFVLEFVEGVEDESAGGARVLGFGSVEVQHYVVAVGGADEAGEVFEADVWHAGDPVDWGF